MSGWELALRLGAGVALVGVNAFFVTTEFALTRAPQLGREAFRGDKRLELAWRMTEELEIYLTGCQLGISASSVVLGIVAEPALTAILAPPLSALGVGETASRATAVVVGVILLQLIHKIWGEQAPTYLGVERPLEVARRTARLHYAFTKLGSPIIKAGDGIAKWTLRLFGVEVTRSWAEEETADEQSGEPQGAQRQSAEAMSPIEGVRRVLSGMPADRRREVERAVAIDTIPLRDVAVPLKDVEVIPRDGDVRDLIASLRRALHVRLPVVDEDLDHCVGMLYVPAALAALPALRRGEQTLADLTTPPLKLSGDTSVADAIDAFQEQHDEVAIVVSESGVAHGLVTITDCLESIVGDLRDPFDLPTSRSGSDPRSESPPRAQPAPNARPPEFPNSHRESSPS